MEINIWGVLAAALLSMVLGFIWYGPLFGKKWMEIIGATGINAEKRKEMQKGAQKLYAISFALAFVQATVFDALIKSLPEVSSLNVAFISWLAFAVPIVAAGAMWNNDSSEVSRARFLINAGYYLVLFAIYGFILGM